MATREINFCIYGATGFTGAKVAEFLISKLAKTSSNPVTVALAGRTKAKLDTLALKISNNSASNISISVIIASNEDKESLNSLALRSEVVINCTGPYRYFGEAVVEACAKNGTHYVDITGEPEFMENMQLKYNQLAEETGCFIISGCGFDSIPGDLGTVFAQKKFSEKFGKSSAPAYVEQVISIFNLKRFHYTTYESAVLGVGSAQELRDIRKKLGTASIPLVNNYRPPKVEIKKERGEYLLPFMGADASVVKRSQVTLSGLQTSDVKVCKHAAYVNIGGKKNYFMLALFGSVFSLLAKYSSGRSLLLKFPSLFSGGMASHKGPSEAELKKTTMEVTLKVVGVKDLSKCESGKVDAELTCAVTGPEPGYVVTPICVVDAALVLLKETETIRQFLGLKGGVVTPGAAFYDTTLVEELTADGVEFKVL